MVGERKRKREFPITHRHHHQQRPKRASFHSGFGPQAFPPESLVCIETLLRPLVREQVERQFEAHCNLRPSSSSSTMEDRRRRGRDNRRRRGGEENYPRERSDEVAVAKGKDTN